MLEKIKVYIYNPSLKTGGTNNLLGNLAVLLSDNAEYSVYYTDYANSPVKNIVLSRNTNINFIEIKENEKIKVLEGIIILTLLDLKTIQQKIEIAENTRILLWSTHPDDALKLLPSFNLWLRLPINISRKISSVIHPFYKKRLKKFLNNGNISNGVVWMDSENVKSNKNFFHLDGELHVLPIFTGSPNIQIDFTKKEFEKPLRIVILGRLTNFKVYPLKGLLEQIKSYQNSHKQNIHIDFIGSGPLKNLLEQWLVELKIENYNFKGHIDLSELDLELVNYHLLIGMGTSTLEGAKLKIPSLIINPSYEIINTENTKLKWLFEAGAYEVGKFVKNSDIGIAGKSISEILSDIDTYEKWEIISLKCYDFWYFNFSPYAIRRKVDEILQNNTFYFNKRNKTLFKKDLSGYAIDYVKSKLK